MFNLLFRLKSLSGKEVFLILFKSQLINRVQSQFNWKNVF